MATEPHPSIDEVILIFGANVRRYRLALKVSQDVLARESGLSITTISALENGIGNPSMKNFVRLAAALNVDIVNLYQGTNRTDAPKALRAILALNAKKPARSKRSETIETRDAAMRERLERHGARNMARS